MSLSFLLADDIHLHERNFKPLFIYLRARDAPIRVHTTHSDLKRCQGDYESITALDAYVAPLRAMSDDSLFAASHPFRGSPIRLFPLCRSEVLSYTLATRDHWHESPVPIDERALFDRLALRDREILYRNLAAAAFWIDEWNRFLASAPLPTHAFAFSGSSTYTRVLLEICRMTQMRAFVVESTFTGREFYLEERYRGIANRSDIRHRSVRDAISLPTSQAALMAQRAIACERIRITENKNVTQPQTAERPSFPDPSRPTLLIIGQVVNDFSIVEQTHGYLSSIAFYQELVMRTLEETSYNVVFKAHPWERRKVHVGRPLTRQLMSAFHQRLPHDLRDRFSVREDDNLLMLASGVDRIALLNSQAGIELAFHEGLKPSTFGAPFYGDAGFTDDYERIDDFIADVRSGRTRAVLTLREYEDLHTFLIKCLVHHVLSDRTPIGTAQSIALRIEGRGAKPLKVTAQPTGGSGSAPPVPKTGAAKSAPAKPTSSAGTVGRPAPATSSALPGSTSAIGAPRAPADPSRSSTRTPSQDDREGPHRSQGEVFARKWKKLRHSPILFVKDSWIARRLLSTFSAQ